MHQTHGTLEFLSFGTQEPSNGAGRGKHRSCWLKALASMTDACFHAYCVHETSQLTQGCRLCHLPTEIECSCRMRRPS